MSADSPPKVLVSVGLSFGTPPDGDPDAGAMEFVRRLHEKGIKLEIAAVSIGGPCAEKALLAALARGAQRGIRVETSAIDAETTCVQLADIVRRERPDLVLLGDREVEDPGSQVGPRLAGILGWPHAGGVLEIQMKTAEKRFRVIREMEGRRERLELAMPAVVGVSVTESDVPLLSLYDIVAARSKPITKVKARKAPPTGLSVKEPAPAPPIRKCRMVSDVDELITALRVEAHVI